MFPLRDYGLKDGERVSLLVNGVGGGGDSLNSLLKVIVHIHIG